MPFNVGLIPRSLLRDGSTAELAEALLASAGGDRTVNANNLMREADNLLHQEPDHATLMTRLSDAWAWLEARGFIGPHPQNTSGETWKQLTTDGLQTLATGSTRALEARERLSGPVDEALHTSALPAFNRGDYETAAFAAMKAVEVAVRELSGLSNSIIGVRLMRAAFGENGPLADPDADPGERVAMMELFAGAIGAFKNPTSHRTVIYSDPVEAAEIVQLGDLLLRLLNRVDRRVRFEE